MNKGSFTRCVFLFAFAMQKMNCVDLNDIVHTVRFFLSAIAFFNQIAVLQCEQYH